MMTEIMSVIYLAGGCFWGMQAYFSGVEGVTATEVGYANARYPNPRYEDTDSDYAEAIAVHYNAAQVPLRFILELYFKAISLKALTNIRNKKNWSQLPDLNW